MSRPRIALSILAAAGLGAGALDGIVDGLERRYGDVRDLRCRFVQTSYVASLGTEQTARGRLLYMRPGRLRWELEEPERHVLVVDAEAVRMFDPEKRTLQIAPAGPSSVSQTALGLLFGETDLRRVFEIAALDLPPDPPGSDAGLVGLRLAPREAAGFERLEAWVDPKTLQVVDLTIFDVLGNRTRLRLEQTEENVGLKEGNFLIRVPEDTEVIDLR
jgi:outer membrane lipoprotein carrier protein